MAPMVFFRKKKKEEVATSPPKKAPTTEKDVKSLQEIAHERVLTAEGWKRHMMLKTSKVKK
jgi:hypothetical protein